ncbi:MAG: response regulator [Deltaproteobacteria bacterium]|nr:response regulator [Deltaproteobacteria bacterium]
MVSRDLTTVHVPEAMKPVFLAAEEIVSRYFQQRADRPEMGSIEISGQRYILVRAASLSVEFFTLVAEMYGHGREHEAEEFSRNILYDLAHAVGMSDARAFHAKMGLQDPLGRLSAGPIHFAHTGWAFVEILPESAPVPGPEYCLIYDHPYSFESEAWLQSGLSRHHPSCIMNAGYSSGWCEESFGLALVSAEVLCRAKGDTCCRFVMAPPEHVERRVRDYIAASPDLASRMGAHSIPDFFSRKRLEEELKESRRELEHRVELRTRELFEAGERLKNEVMERRAIEERLRQADKLEAIGRLSGGIAHDFNNLLTVIQGNAQLALNEIPPTIAARSVIEEVLRAAERAASLTQQLLAFSRQQVLSPEALDLNAVVESLAVMLRRVIGEDIALELQLDPARPRVRADSGQIDQVLMNLAINARDAMPGGGRLRLETRLDGDWAKVLVQDSGQGMDQETLARIFEPFFTTKGRGKGTGLGLATVYGIVKQSQGEIAVSSEPGAGSRFEIRLPTTQEALGKESPSAAVSDLNAGSTIMLVEDEDAVRNLLTKVLSKAGYRVISSGSPEEALDRLTGPEPPSIDLLLTDVVMPGMSGKVLAERLTARLPNLRVLFMSGYTDQILESELGDGEFIQKPCSLDVLQQKVRRALAGKTPGLPATQR